MALVPSSCNCAKTAWGVPGSAWGIVLAQTISVILCVLYIHHRLPVLHLTREDWVWDKHFALEHLRIGIPMACQFSILGIGIDYQQVIKGLVLLAAVFFDVYNKQKQG